MRQLAAFTRPISLARHRLLYRLLRVQRRQPRGLHGLLRSGRLHNLHAVHTLLVLLADRLQRGRQSGLLDDAEIDEVTEEELVAALKEGRDVLGRVRAAVLDDHRLLALAHQLQLVVDQLRDHVVLRLTRSSDAHARPDGVIEQMLVGVVELVHVPADGVPQIHAQSQDDGVALLLLTHPHRAYCRMRAVALVQAQRLHGDVVDVQVLHAVERREREGDHTLELRVVLWIRPARERHLVLVATHPLDFAVAKTAPALLAVSLQLQVVVVVSTRHR